MVRKNGEYREVVIENPMGGKGINRMKHLLNCPDEIAGKGRLFGMANLDPGSELGYHQHKGDAEIYYFLEGVGEFNDNGTLVAVHPGDITYCADGECHGVKNTGDTPLRYLAIVLYS